MTIENEEQFKLRKGVVSPDINNKFIISDIVDSECVTTKQIKIQVGFKYIHFDLGEEFMNDPKKLELWLESKTEEIFEEYKQNPQKFREKIIYRSFIR